MKGKTNRYHKGDIALKERELNFTTAQLIEALFDVQYLLERCSCPFVLLNETARQTISESRNLEPHLELDEITVGVKESHFAQSVREMMRTVKPDAMIEDSNVSYTFKDIPIIIWRIKRDYQVLDRPDKIFFYTEDFYIPNPFNKYWKMRDLMI